MSQPELEQFRQEVKALNARFNNQLSAPERTDCLLVAALAVVDARAVLLNGRFASREEFLLICGWAFDQLRTEAPGLFGG